MAPEIRLEFSCFVPREPNLILTQTIRADQRQVECLLLLTNNSLF
jgi:hypothetical protein